jgi:hypothetical protein
MTLGLSVGFKKNRKRKIVDYLPMVFFCGLYFFLAGVTMYEFPFYLGIVALAFNISMMNQQALIDDRSFKRKL